MSIHQTLHAEPTRNKQDILIETSSGSSFLISIDNAKDLLVQLKEAIEECA